MDRGPGMGMGRTPPIRWKAFGVLGGDGISCQLIKLKVFFSSLASKMKATRLQSVF